MSNLLIVDDEQSMCEFLEILFSKEGMQVRAAHDIKKAQQLIEKHLPDLVITDLKMKGGSGIDLLSQTKQAHPEIEFIVITAFATDETAIEALKMGAYDYVTKPFQVDEIKVVAQRALERQRLLRENIRMRAELTAGYDFGSLIGKSPRMQEVYRLIELVAPTKSNILITGESGTGKELVAKAIHVRSDRRDQAFVPIDCGSIPETLMESELFGHLKGSFTGATTDRKGLFELADQGTAFLDEIGEVPLNLQVKLLRVLQERTVKRLGGTTDRQVDVRLIAATNRNLEQEVEQGRFRSDLYYRLNVIRLHLPPLRQRKEDIADLVRHFVHKIADQEKRPAPLILSDTFDALDSYDFPGNVRELENLVERAIALCDNRPIEPSLFLEYLQHNDKPPDQRAHDSFPQNGVDLESILASTERDLIQQAMVAANGVKKQAARLLGISFRSLRYRLAKLNMEAQDDEDG